MIFCYSHRLVLYPVIIREVSSISRWKRWKNSYPNIMLRESLNGGLCQILPHSEFKEPCGRGDRNIVRSIDDEGLQEKKAL